mmetsp:Transcript_14996/g.26273  ORF Transcript_14996/g.26273 Transcript_14996/m.26273 type:complete len:410 (-) Transcript_14996:73-1302(-)|eukprot:CAMPEP_0197658912 /NCGR_PEP_ID=MMETSP1338-20131121/45525_1 /TAXON_ID=43686 ORGANISM="Pelagodinium beii, Strain RCC1491" /NCGR_SAMPLE_ID=MMETSP1338 /ASSEMBLY_ACC=CAM_ASM_000754 /LENGTH=409 /DNA_ID=CAMNT_0043235601 /DNA_START=63 /DNA_END=1292 /DNA_ORIENTATION=+
MIARPKFLFALVAVVAGIADGVDLSRGFPYPPDTRPKGCRKYRRKDFANHTVSIVIPWLAEKWTHMEGTMKALLHFTPDELVEEYIWISDGNADSKETELKALSPKVKVIAFQERQGLIRAKMKGVEMATAPVLVFMEAHVIPNKHWLQHILHRVVQNPKVLAMPTLDGIPQENWHAYRPMPPGHWRYEWNFNLIYTNPGDLIRNDGPEPYTSPGTSGGIFAMRRDWFLQLGLFDVGMKEWGGDHMELTMKVWRCGGRIEIVPCSRVGHLFRDPGHRPYEVEVNTVVYNYKRLAELWAKDHLDYFYKMKPEAVGMKLSGMDQVIKNYERLEQDLKCKDLDWYLENIDHEMAWEKDHICHPYAARGDPIKCKGQLVPGRWTVTKTIPVEVYQHRKKAAEERFLEPTREDL